MHGIIQQFNLGEGGGGLLPKNLSTWTKRKPKIGFFEFEEKFGH